MSLQNNILTIIHGVSDVDLDNFVYSRVRFNGTTLSGVADLEFPLIIKSFSAATDASVVLLGSPRNAEPWECGPLGSDILLGLCITVISAVVAAFQSLCSFVFDGVDEHILLDSSLRNTSSGIGVAFTYFYVLKRTTSGTLEVIHSRHNSPNDFSYRCDFSGDNIRAIIYDDGDGSNVRSTTTTSFTDTTEWLVIAIVVDVSEALAVDQVKIFVRDAEAPQTTSGGPITQVFSGTADEKIGTADGSPLQGSFNFIGLINKAINLTEYQTWNNGGEPIKLSEVFTSSEIIEEMYPQDAVFEDGGWSTINSPYSGNSRGYEFDGVNEFFDFGTQINSFVTGTDKKFSINFFFKRNDLTAFQLLEILQVSPLDRAFTIGFVGTQLRFTTYPTFNGGSSFSYTTSTNFDDINTWYYITISIDSTQSSIPDIITFQSNGVKDIGGSTIGSPSNLIGLSTQPLLISTREGSSFFGNFVLKNFSVVNVITSLTKHQNLYNNGDILDLNTEFSDSEIILNPTFQNDTFSAGTHTIIDSSSNGFDGTTVNMEEFDLSNSNHPGGGRSVNMEIEDQDCDENPY